jgi:hypothetical protein
MLYLRGRGHEVSGIDVDATVIALCRERGLSDVHVASYDRMPDFGTFDSVLLLGRNLGMAGNMEGLSGLFRACREVCRPNGRLILDGVEVDPEHSNRGPGVVERRLRYRYAGTSGPGFGWIRASGDVLRPVLSEPGWDVRHVYHDGDVYAMVAWRV